VILLESLSSGFFRLPTDPNKQEHGINNLKYLMASHQSREHLPPCGFMPFYCGSKTGVGFFGLVAEGTATRALLSLM